MNTLEAMQALLTPENAEKLRRIYSPTVVCKPVEDARRSLCIMPDGEIRMFGQIDKPHPHINGKHVYLASRDCGLSWTMHDQEEGSIGPSMRSPYSGRYVMVREAYDGFPGIALSPRSGEYIITGSNDVEKGTFVFTSEGGPACQDAVKRRISDTSYADFFLPKALKKKRRLITASYRRNEKNRYTIVVMTSDDDGETWHLKELPPLPVHEMVYPHRNVRWQNNGSEPVLAELESGEIMLLARTSQDVFYVAYSSDHGDTFSDFEPSCIHGTLTTPSLTELSDGRVVLVWCNTQPLPEINVDSMAPEFTPEERAILEEGRSEDVFTNRDVAHIALTRDGRHWTGMRELVMNPLRNQPDFRTSGNINSSLDKSVHQSQAIELPFGKLLVCVGQHEAVRTAVILDLNWIEEKDRKEDFGAGLTHVTTHVYVKSYSGCAWCERLAGHCQYNRTNGALLVPCGPTRFRESLLIGRTQDPRLLSDKQGVVWNFPARMTGTVDICLKIEGAGVRVCLSDHWYNVTDDVVRDEAPFTFTLEKNDLLHEMAASDQNGFVTVSVCFDDKQAWVWCGEKLLFSLRKRTEAPNGLSYLHIQTLAEQADFAGTLIASMHSHD